MDPAIPAILRRVHFGVSLSCADLIKAPARLADKVPVLVKAPALALDILHRTDAQVAQMFIDLRRDPGDVGDRPSLGDVQDQILVHQG